MERDYLLALPKAPMESHPLLLAKEMDLTMTRGSILERSGEGIYMCCWILKSQKPSSAEQRINKSI